MVLLNKLTEAYVVLTLVVTTVSASTRMTTEETQTTITSETSVSTEAIQTTKTMGVNTTSTNTSVTNSTTKAVTIPRTAAIPATTNVSTTNTSTTISNVPTSTTAATTTISPQKTTAPTHNNTNTPSTSSATSKPPESSSASSSKPGAVSQTTTSTTTDAPISRTNQLTGAAGVSIHTVTWQPKSHTTETTPFDVLMRKYTISAPPTTRKLRYSTMTFNEANQTCPFGYRLDGSRATCIHLCEDIACQHGGWCYVEIDVNNATVPRCRCAETKKYVFSGDHCETTTMSRGQKRGITLGVLITTNVLFIVGVVLLCYRKQKEGNRLQAAQKSYDVNNL